MALKHKDIVFPEVPHDGTLGLKLHDTKGNEIFSEYSNTPWSTLWEIHRNQWTKYAEAYEAEPSDFYHAWHYLEHHPAFWKFRHGSNDARPLPLNERLHMRHLEDEGGIHRCVDTLVVKVNSETRDTDTEPATETEIWVELGKQPWPGNPEEYDTPYHDYMLDCGAPTMETAFLRAAYNVWTVYGNDRRVCDAPYDDSLYEALLDDEEFAKVMRSKGDDGHINQGVRNASARFREIIKERKRKA